MGSYDSHHHEWLAIEGEAQELFRNIEAADAADLAKEVELGLTRRPDRLHDHRRACLRQALFSTYDKGRARIIAWLWSEDARRYTEVGPLIAKAIAEGRAEPYCDVCGESGEKLRTPVEVCRDCYDNARSR